MGKVIWLTGESGAGKSAVADELRRTWFPKSIILDGDQMRNSISRDAGFSREDRAEHNLRVAWLARELSKQTDVLVAVIAPIAEIRKQIDEICDPTWVWIKRTLPERENHFYEKPTDYFVVDHDVLSVEESADAIEGNL